MSESEIEARVLSGKSWEDFCDALKEAGKQVLRPEAPSSVLDRAEGWRYLSRLLRLGLESKLEFSDTDFPGVYALSHETAKIGADNPDNIYHNITIDGSKEYRIFGKRGTVPYFSWGTKVNRYTTDGTMASIGELNSDSLIVEADGTYEIILSQTRKGKNWLPIAPDSTMVLGRQTFLDRKTEIPATAKVERIGGPKHPEPLSAERLERGLQETAAFVLGTARAFADLSADFKRKPNDWITTEQEHWYRIGGDPKIFYLHLYWELEPDEALVIESKVPECAFWNLQVDNWWWESLDYRHLPVHVQKGNAKLNKDGSVMIVIAAKDMGVGNYLDTAGHTAGTVLMRWVDAKSHPIPTCRVVKLSETIESLEGEGDG
jgi:hypothetical protein